MNASGPQRDPLGHRLLLVDGLAGAYRVFFAIRNLSTRDGRPTNAVFGFVRMMQQLGRLWMPTHCAVVFDGGIPAARLSLVPDYKANRKPMPDALREQLPILNEYLESAQIPTIRMDGCEADDVIATMAHHAEQDGVEVLIATGDKDLFQLVGPHTRIVSLTGDAVSMNADAVTAKTGVPPERIPDWLALTGDPADNIKGVPGIGPKTAARLLTEFGSLDAIYRQLEGVSSLKLRDSLNAAREIVARNLEMVRLDRQIPGVPGWRTFKKQREPLTPLLEFFRRYELNAFADALSTPELF